MSEQLAGIPKIRQQLASLLWALFFGVECAEIHWRRDGAEWWVERLSWIHSRRLAYPDPNEWELHIWDQGSVYGSNDFGTAPTSRLFGIKVSDYPGKFISHAPQLRADYPTRDGLGRIIGNWMLLKRLASRAASQYLDRFARPIGDGEFATTDDGTPREATDEDKQALKAALEALGLGTLTSFTHPDCVKLNLLQPDGGGAPKLTFSEFLAYADAQITKAVLGQTYTTEPGAFGAKGTADVGKAGAMQIGRFDASDLGETLRRDLVTAIVRLNRPDALDVVPCIELHVEDEPSPADVAKVALQLVTMGMPLDGEDLAKRTGFELVDPDNEKAVRLAFVKPTDLSSIDKTIAPPVQPPALGAGPDDNAEPDGDEPDAEAEDPEDDTEEPPASSERTARDDFAERHAALLADMKDLRSLDCEVDQDTVNELAEYHRVPAPRLRAQG